MRCRSVTAGELMPRGKKSTGATLSKPSAPSSGTGFSTRVATGEGRQSALHRLAPTKPSRRWPAGSEKSHPATPLHPAGTPHPRPACDIDRAPPAHALLAMLGTSTPMACVPGVEVLLPRHRTGLGEAPLARDQDGTDFGLVDDRLEGED